MILVVLVGIIAILLMGGGIPQILIYMAIVGSVCTHYEDSNRRGGWWK